MKCCALLLLSLALGSCVHDKVSEGLKKTQGILKEELNSLEKKSSNQRRNISWSQALETLYRQNLGYRRSKDSIKTSKENLKKQWWSLVPKVGAFASLANDLDELTNLNSDDISLSVVSNLSIPNPFLFYAQRYANAIQLESSKLTHEHMRRSLYIRLQKSYLRQLENEELESLNRLKKRSLTSVPIDDLKATLSDIQTRKALILAQKSQNRMSLNNLLNTPGENWYLTSGAPVWSYENKLNRIKLGEHYGKLGLMMSAVQLETAILSRMKVKISRLPFLSFGTNSPTLYSSERFGGQDLNDMRLFSSLSKTIDFSDPLDLKEQRKAEKRLLYVRESLRLTMEREIDNFKHLKLRYKSVQQEKSKYEEQLERLNKKRLGSDTKTLTTRIKEAGDIEKKLATAEMQIRKMELILLEWDEEYWSKHRKN